MCYASDEYGGIESLMTEKENTYLNTSIFMCTNRIHSNMDIKI
jgi:hypothetical protein